MYKRLFIPMTTFDDDDGADTAVSELTLTIDIDDNPTGGFLKLEDSRIDPQTRESSCEAVVTVVEQHSISRRWSLCFWVKLVALFICLGLLAVVFLKWVGPYFMDKDIIPILNWETKTFSDPILAILVFTSVALFPTLLLPSTPSMWVAGMTFGYGFGFLLIISAASVGVSLPYFIGYLFYHKIQGWLERYPKRASILRCAGEGNWIHQFRAVTLIRISPFPYILYNYCALATNVKYGPYLLGSFVGIVPEVFVAIYTGILIRTLADASHERQTLSAPQIIFTVVGFLATVATTVFFTIYAKRRLSELQNEDEPLLQ